MHRPFHFLTVVKDREKMGKLDRSTTSSAPPRERKTVKKISQTQDDRKKSPPVEVHLPKYVLPLQHPLSLFYGVSSCPFTWYIFDDLSMERNSTLPVAFIN